jgi:hypothetical protein
MITQKNLTLAELEKTMSEYASNYMGYPVLVKVSRVNCLDMLTIDQWASIVFSKLNIPHSVSAIRNRKFDNVLARQMMCFTLSIYSTYTLTKIAEYFKQDHTTVIHARNRFGDLLKAGDRYATDAYMLIHPILLDLQQNPNSATAKKYIPQID